MLWTGLRALVATGALLVATGCSTSVWRAVDHVTVSPDGRTLTVGVIFSRPESHPEPCERVADTTVEESASKVVIGVLVEEDVCDRPWPWEEPVYSMLAEYRHPVRLSLKAPLGDRTVVNVATGRSIAVG